MNKEFYIIDTSTNIISQVVICEESEVNNLYPNNSILPINDEESPRAYPGCLYYGGLFWSPMSHVVSTTISHDEFRKLFTFEELKKIDNFFNDPNLTGEQKEFFNTNSRSFDLARIIDLNDERIIQGIDFLVEVGYLTSDRASKIKDNQRYESV